MEQYDGEVTLIWREQVFTLIKARLMADEAWWGGVLGGFAQGSGAFQPGDEVILRLEGGREGWAKVTDVQHRRPQEIRSQGHLFAMDMMFTPRRVEIEGQGPPPFGQPLS